MPNLSTIRRQAKRFKETDSVKNRKVNRRHHVRTKETLDEIAERLEHTPKNLYNVYHRKLECVICTKSNKMTEITYTYCEYTHVRTMRIPV